MSTPLAIKHVGEEGGVEVTLICRLSRQLMACTLSPIAIALLSSLYHLTV